MNPNYGAFRELAARYGMASLVEVHNADELAIAPWRQERKSSGVNNRDLNTFEVKLENVAEFNRENTENTS